MTAIQEIRQFPTRVHLEPTQQSKETRANWLRWITDPEIRQWICGTLPTQPDEVYRWVYNATNDPRRHYFDIQTDGRAIGFVILRQDQIPALPDAPAGTTGEISIVIGDKQYQGRGIGTQAIDTLLTYAKNVAHLTSVRALIKPDNIKSIKLFANAGFALTGDVTIEGTPLLKFEKQLQASTQNIPSNTHIETSRPL